MSLKVVKYEIGKIGPMQNAFKIADFAKCKEGVLGVLNF
jgi:hypothetical protein